MKFIKSLSIYTLSSIANSGISFLLLPIFTHYLTPKDYGILSLFTLGISIASPFILLSSHGAIQIEYYKISKSEFKSFIGSAFFTNAGLFLFMLLLALIVGPFISGYLDIPFNYFLLIPLIAFLQVVPQALLVLFQAGHEALNFAKFSFSQAILNLSLGLAFVILLNMNWKGRIISIGLTYFLFFLIAFKILWSRRIIDFKVKTKYIRHTLLFGLPLLPHTLGALIIEFSDRLFITKMVNVSELGIYNVGYQIAMVISLLEISFNQAFVPQYYDSLKEDSYSSKIRLINISILFLIVLFATLILLHFGSYIIFDYFIDKNFIGGQKYVFWIGLGYFFSGVYKVFVGPIFFFNKTYILSYMAVVNICINLIFNYLLIKRFGAIGAAYATALSFFIVALLTIYFSNKIYKLPWIPFFKTVVLRQSS